MADVPAALEQVRTALQQSVQQRADPDAQQAFFLLVQEHSTDSELPAWWTPMRDQALRQYWKREGLLASTIYAMQAIVSTVGWVVEGEDDQQKAAARIPLDEADFGAGFKATVKKLAEDWLTQDNGIFIEILGPGDASGPLLEPPTGIAHLDAGRCWRSGDPEYPVWYYNQKSGKWHKMHWTRVAFAAPNPSAMEAARGVGYCMVSRVAQFAAIMRDTVRFKLEKIGGRQTRAILTINGVTREAVELAIKEAERVADNAGQVRFSAVPIIAAPGGQVEVNAQLLELAGVLDGFDWNDELTLYLYVLALALGMDARELWPATTSGATKADAEVQHRKAMRKGVGDFLSTLAFIINQRVMPEGVTFDFKPKDSEEDQDQANLEKTRIEAVAVLVREGILTRKGAITYLVNADVLPKEYLDDEELSILKEPEPVIEQPSEGDGGAGGTSSDETEIQEAAGRRGFFRRIADRIGAAFGRKTIISFRTRIQAVIRAYYKGDIESRANFVELMYSILTEGYRQAWTEGAKEGGIRFEELTPDELIALQTAINHDFQYVVGLAEAIEGQPHEKPREEISALYDRGELWVNRYSAVKAQAQSMALADQKLKWVYGDTEHCATCNALNGRVYRGSVWAANVLPQSRKLDCGGWRCQCRLEKTEDRITPGRFPKSLLRT